MPWLALALGASATSAQDSLGSQQRTEKISELEGGFGGDLHSHDLFGIATATLGDLDGDGNADLAVATRDTHGIPTIGKVWILFMNADGTVRDEERIDLWFLGGFWGDDFEGPSLAALGDLDGDGVGDLAVGDAEGFWGGPGRGVVFILFLNADGTVKGLTSISSLFGGFQGPLHDFDHFGSSLAALDPSAEGAVLDLAVGAIGDDSVAHNAGAVWILSLAADGSVIAQHEVLPPVEVATGPPLASLSDDAERIAFGSSVAALDDVNGDELRDLVVGARRDDDGGEDAGAIWVLFRGEGGGVLGGQKISAAHGGLGEVLEPDDNFGAAVTTLGDLNQDGIVDVAVGAPGDDDGGEGLGGVWLLFLLGDGSVKEVLKLSDDDPGFDGLLEDHDAFGSSLGFIADLDGNGLPEITVGAPGDDDGGDENGALYVVFFQFPDVIVNNGSGINPSVFVPGFNPPQLGVKWDPFIDVPAAPPGGINFHLIGVSTRRQSSTLLAAALASAPNIVGELLISIVEGDLQLTQSVLPGEHFAVGIPNDTAVIGLECYSQGVILEGGSPSTIRFTNGLDVIIGFPAD